MLGVVNENCEAIIRIVVIVVGNTNAQRQVIDAVVDTGFTGFLTLPSTIITSLGLSWSSRERGTLGDGSIHIFDVYMATVIWDGQTRTTDVNEADTDPLIGMSLIYGYDLRIQAIEGGTVTIQPLS